MADVEQQTVPTIPMQPGPFELRKDGAVSRMRNHRGNAPVLPQTKLCPKCPAKFTRTTHLNRHLRTHTNERLHRCDTCTSQFTRSDLLARHKRSCGDPAHANRTRRKSCKSCAESKIKCDLQQPCSKCKSRGRECTFLTPGQDQSERSTSEESKTEVPSGEPHPLPSASEGIAGSSYLTPAEPNGGYNNLTPDPVSAAYAESADAIFNGFTELDLLSTASPPAPSESADSHTNVLSSIASDFDGIPVNTHLSARYSSDMFEPLFSTLFSTAEAAMAAPDDAMWTEGMGTQSESPPDNYGFPFATPHMENVQPTRTSVSDETLLQDWSEPSMFAPPPTMPPSSQTLQPQRSESVIASRSNGAGASVDGDPPMAERRHYMYLFYSAFLAQMPIIHPHTFTLEDKCPVLISAMEACGALYVKTRTANAFVKRKLAQAREALIQEFARNPTDTNEQITLILAVVLLQTIGLFHQKPDQRASSNMYHGMLVMMIRRSGLISKSAEWQPANLGEVSLESAWHEWAKQEMTKRALMLSYLHDTCHSIYFALPPSYQSSELEFNLPCEEALWKASTATDWFLILRETSPYGPTHSRLTGISMHRALATITESRLLPETIPLSPFAHFALIHAILGDFCSTRCVARRDSTTFKETSRTPPTQTEDERREQIVFTMQFALHNWLQNWLSSPDVPRMDSAGEEPPFTSNALPFYWLGQVSLLAYQERIPPFEPGAASDAKIEKRFRLIKQWLKHIRGFVKRDDQEPTLFWDELMKIRLQSTQPDGEKDDQEGLLGFFPDHAG